MILWRTSWHDPHDGTCYLWAANETDLDLKRRDEWHLLYERIGRPKFINEKIALPDTLGGMVTWLNAYHTRDNG
jgi:hypothetical protein